MKRILLSLICLLILVSAAGCINVYPSGDPDATPTDDILAEDTSAPAAIPTAPAETVMPTVMPSDTPQITAPTPDATPVQTPIGMSGEPVNTAEFYSSYAHMVSYDPARGWAEFDYFDMLLGQDAIDWMVAEEGYTLADAEAEVAQWGDGEFWYKNISAALRTIDLKEVEIELMFEADGTPSPDSSSIPSTIDDVFALYNLDTHYLYDNFFYYIHVDADGNVTKVQQVYWC